MRNSLTLATTAAMMIAGALTLSAQATRPAPQSPATPPAGQQRPMTDDRQRPSATAAQEVTITGCLKEEKDIPGRKDSVAVRGHMDNDFVLTNVKMAEGSATSAIGLNTMYEIKGIDSELKGHLNHQIQVTGTVESAGATPTGTSDLRDLKATSMKMIAATCPAGQ